MHPTLAAVVRWLIFISYAVLIVIVGYVDYITGFVPDLTILYLAPIVLTAVRFGLGPATGLSLLAFAAIEISDLARLKTFSVSAYLDGLFHLAVFLAAAYTAVRLSQNYRQIEDLQKDLSHDFEIAKAAQKAMFPPAPPTVPGLEIGVKMAFARAVGGDFYDILPRGASGLGIMIADISGKSMGAALFTALLREKWRSAAAQSGDPARIVKELNDSLYAELPPDMFVTLFCGFLDIDSGELQFVNAGHEPGILFQKDLRSILLASPEPMIVGIAEQVKAPRQATACGPGALLVLYTDGLIEPRSEGFGEEEIINIVTAHADESAQKIVEAVYNSRFGEDRGPIDDVIIVGIKRKMGREETRL